MLLFEYHTDSQGRAVAAQCYIDHRRLMREIERKDLMRMTENFGLHLFLQPTREPQSFKGEANDHEYTDIQVR